MPCIKDQGPIVSFYIQRGDGSYVSPSEVATLAEASGILLRAGMQYTHDVSISLLLSLNVLDTHRLHV